MTNHTPSPWTRPNNKGTIVTAQNFVPGRTGYIASVNFVKDAETTEANAVLIENAPALLDALQCLIAAIQKARTIKAPAGHYDEDVYYNGIDFAPQLDIAEEIIKKATNSK